MFSKPVRPGIIFVKKAIELHTGRLRPYSEILDHTGKFCEGQNTLAYFTSSSVTNKNIFKPFFFVTDALANYARVVAPKKFFRLV